MGHERLADQAEEISDIAELLTAIHEQGRQTYDLVRALVALLTPAEGGREGPTLEELLAKIMAQQKEIIALGRQNQNAITSMGQTLPGAVVEAMDERRISRSC